MPFLTHLDSLLNVALWLGQLAIFAVVFVLAYHQNRADYRDSRVKGLLWACALAGAWPLTLIVWFVARRRFVTPFSPRHA